MSNLRSKSGHLVTKSGHLSCACCLACPGTYVCANCSSGSPSHYTVVISGCTQCNGCLFCDPLIFSDNSQILSGLSIDGTYVLVQTNNTEPYNCVYFLQQNIMSGSVAQYTGEPTCTTGSGGGANFELQFFLTRNAGNFSLQIYAYSLAGAFGGCVFNGFVTTDTCNTSAAISNVVTCSCTDIVTGGENSHYYSYAGTTIGNAFGYMNGGTATFSAC